MSKSLTFIIALVTFPFMLFWMFLYDFVGNAMIKGFKMSYEWIETIIEEARDE